MKYGIIWKVLALGAKDGNRIFRPGDALAESDIENFDKMVKQEAIKEITKAEFDKLYDEKNGQSKKEVVTPPVKEDDKPPTEDPEITAIKEGDEFKTLIKLNKAQIIEQLKAEGYIGEIDETQTKEVLAIQVIRLIEAD